MRKIILLIMTALVLTGCFNDTEDNDMKEDNTYQIALDFSDGTGFEWTVVYHSKNVKVEKTGAKVDRNDPTESGGRGKQYFNCQMSDDEEAVIILKYSRPWEDSSDADFITYHLKDDDGKPEEIRIEEDRTFSDKYTFIHNSAEKGYLRMNVESKWAVREYDQGHQIGFTLNHDENEMKFFHDTEFELEEGYRETDRIFISEKEYVVYENKDQVMLVCPEGFGWQGSAELLDDEFTAIIRMIDTMGYEE